MTKPTKITAAQYNAIKAGNKALAMVEATIWPKPPGMPPGSSGGVKADPRPVPTSGFRLIIGGRFPSLNEILRVKASRYRGKWNNMKVEWQTVVRRSWEGQGKPCVKTCYRVEYLYVVSDKRRDLSNIHAAAEKIVLDALVNCGALPGDGFKWHIGSSYAAKLDKTMDAVMVTVTSDAGDF